jgi:hypothetical protein
VVKIIPMPDKIRSITSFVLILASAMGSAISMMSATERHLEKTFDAR